MTAARAAHLNCLTKRTLFGLIAQPAPLFLSALSLSHFLDLSLDFDVRRDSPLTNPQCDSFDSFRPSESAGFLRIRLRVRERAYLGMRALAVQSIK